MNKKKLRSRMVEHGDTFRSLAGVLKMSYGSFSQKINGKRAFTQPQIQTIISRYNLNPTETQEIFFANGVD